MENPRAGDARVKSQTGSVTAAAFEEALGGGGKCHDASHNINLKVGGTEIDIVIIFLFKEPNRSTLTQLVTES